MQVQGFHANPVVRQRHFARDRLPFSPELPTLIMGGSQLLRDTPIPLTLEGEPILIFAPPRRSNGATRIGRSEEHTYELQSLMRILFAVFFLKKKTNNNTNHNSKLNYT